MLYENVGRFIDAATELGWESSRTDTASTVVLRGNQSADVNGEKLYADPRIRRGLSLAIDNAICLELGYGDRGEVAANHHVAPIQPDYADIGPPRFAPAEGRALIVQAGKINVTHDVVTLDDGVARRTGEAVVALLLDADIPARQTVLPGSRFWSAWKDFPLSITEWNHRPLGVQTLSLAYRSGAVWNESAYANSEFDAALTRARAIASAEERREVMAEAGADAGRGCGDRAALLARAVPAFPTRYPRGGDAPILRDPPLRTRMGRRGARRGVSISSRE